MAQLSQEDVISLVKEKTGCFKADLRLIFDALEDSLIELLSEATVEDPVDIKLFKGFIVKSKRIPSKLCTDPRNGNEIMSREKIKTSVTIKLSFKNKVDCAACLNGKLIDE